MAAPAPPSPPLSAYSSHWRCEDNTVRNDTQKYAKIKKRTAQSEKRESERVKRGIHMLNQHNFLCARVVKAPFLQIMTTTRWTIFFFQSSHTHTHILFSVAAVGVVVIIVLVEQNTKIICCLHSDRNFYFSFIPFLLVFFSPSLSRTSSTSFDISYDFFLLSLNPPLLLYFVFIFCVAVVVLCCLCVSVCLFCIAARPPPPAH